MLVYPVIITKEGRDTLAEFPDCPGCQTFAEPGQDILEVAQEALEGWLETHLLEEGDVPPHPSHKGVVFVPVSPLLAAKLHLRWAREEAGLSQEELGNRMGISQQAVAKLEHPSNNTSLRTLARAALAMGRRVAVEFEVVDVPTQAKPVRRLATARARKTPGTRKSSGPRR